MNLSHSLTLVLVTDDALLVGRDPVATCIAAVRGGVTMVQLRLKHASDPEVLELTRTLVSALPVPLIVNDRLDIALIGGAAGVHLGSDDLPPALARRIAPPGFIIGASVGTPEEIPRGFSADYWGVGPLHISSTKVDAGAALGWDGVRRIVAESSGRPVVAIGGVRPEDVAEARHAGCAGVAVVSGILGAEDVEAASRAYKKW